MNISIKLLLSGIVFNIALTPYCTCCNTGFFGDSCTDSTLICQNLFCINGGTCETNSSTTCLCGATTMPTQGNFCEVTNNLCDNLTCTNDGSLVHLGDTFRCDCQKAQNDCEGITIPTGATCVDAIETYYMICQASLFGKDCQQTIDPDFDIQFYPSASFEGAKITTPFLLGSTAISISFWFKLQKVEGYIFELYESPSLKTKSDTKSIISISTSSVQFNIGDQSQIYHYASDSLTINQWFHMVVTWDGASAGQLNIYINSNKLFDLQNYATNVQLAEYGIIVLGSKFSTLDWYYVDGKKMEGLISKVYLWSTKLTHSDVTNLSIDPTSNHNTNTNSIIVYWGDYTYKTGVSIRRPSSSDIRCIDGFTGPSCETESIDRFCNFPNLNKCLRPLIERWQSLLCHFLILSDLCSLSIDVSEAVSSDSAINVVYKLFGFRFALQRILPSFYILQSSPENITFMVGFSLVDCPIDDKLFQMFGTTLTSQKLDDYLSL
ncbi:hypothetical protein A3Q56_07123 [Intoshia linei]|uniref:EGF-like domain-containing protein n=1 Tax=Intoshia linei TaxID=1819745 RepID=A0A177AT29_9BILA|nr:hypothetical protein A3Q56_07123 [Intoshia linei]